MSATPKDQIRYKYFYGIRSVRAELWGITKLCELLLLAVTFDHFICLLVYLLYFFTAPHGHSIDKEKNSCFSHHILVVNKISAVTATNKHSKLFPSLMTMRGISLIQWKVAISLSFAKILFFYHIFFSLWCSH